MTYAGVVGRGAVASGVGRRRPAELGRCRVVDAQPRSGQSARRPARVDSTTGARRPASMNASRSAGTPGRAAVYAAARLRAPRAAPTISSTAAVQAHPDQRARPHAAVDAGAARAGSPRASSSRVADRSPVERPARSAPASRAAGRSNSRGRSVAPGTPSRCRSSATSMRSRSSAGEHVDPGDQRRPGRRSPRPARRTNRSTSRSAVSRSNRSAAYSRPSCRRRPSPRRSARTTVRSNFGRRRRRPLRVGREPGQVTAGRAPVLEGEHHLEQRVPRQRPLGVQLLDEPLERHVLVRVRREVGLAHPGEQLAEASGRRRGRCAAPAC